MKTENRIYQFKITLKEITPVIWRRIHVPTHFLEAVLNPMHEEHKEMLEWCGGKYNPNDFDPKNVHFDNPKKRLRKAFSNSQ